MQVLDKRLTMGCTTRVLSEESVLLPVYTPDNQRTVEKTVRYAPTPDAQYALVTCLSYES